MRKDVKRSFSLFSLGIVRYLSTAVLHVFLANHMLPVLYGDFNIAVKLLNLFIDFSLYGSAECTSIFLGKYINQNKKVKAIKYVAWNLKLLARTLVVAFLIAISAIMLMLICHAMGWKDINQYYLSFYMFWIVPFGAIALLLRSYTLSAKQVYLAAVFPSIVLPLTELLFFCVIIYFFHLPLNNLLVVTVLISSYVLVCLVLLYYVNRRLLELIISAVKHRRNIKQVTANLWFNTSSKLIITSVMFSLIGTSDIVIVKLFAHDHDAVGYYSAILMIVSSVWLIPKSIYPALRSQYSSLSERGKDPAQLRLFMYYSSIVLANLVVIVTILILIFSKPLLAIFGPSYLQAVVPLRVLVILVGAGVILRTDKATVLNFAGHTRLMLKLDIIELILVLLLVIPATFYFGIVGTAVATGLIILLFKPTALAYFLFKKLKIRSSYFFFLWYFVK